MKSYKAVVFDMDGTLLDTLEDLATSVNYALKKHNQKQKTLSEVKSAIGNGVRRLIGGVLDNGEDNPCFEEVLSSFKAYYKDHNLDYTKPYPGIEELLSDIKLKGMKVGIVSNKIHTATVFLADYFFENKYDIALGDDGIRPKKPAKEPALACLEALNLKSEEVLYVGDSTVDYEFSKNSNMDCILVSYGFDDKDILQTKPALAVVDSVEELKNLII